MSKNILSVFVDESGDFGSFESHTPYYLVSLILHNQSIDISEDINLFDSHLLYLGHKNHAIHTGPLIRRESTYKNDLIEERKYLFNALFFHVEFRKVTSVDYKMFQVADLICTIELIAEKISSNTISKSELEFFNNMRDFKKNYLKHIRKKLL